MPVTVPDGVLYRMTRDELRAEAARLGIKGRSRMSKDELLNAIEKEM